MSTPNIAKKVFKRKLEQFKQRGGGPGKRNKKRENEEAVEPGLTHAADDDEQQTGNKRDGAEQTLEIESPNQSTLAAETDDHGNESQKPAPPKEVTKTANVAAAASILTDVKFSSLAGRVSAATLQAIEQGMGFARMTDIQAKSIPPLLEGKDVLGAAKTGSGKTLAFLVPAIEQLLRANWRLHYGTGVLIISPTRELSMQTYGVLYELMERHPSLSHGLVMGGANRQTEAQRLAKGVAILVATPGRLLDHLQNTADFVVRNLRMLIVDEADRIFDIGFEQEMHQIVRLLPQQKRQTALFSATCSPKVDELVRSALKTNPLKIGVMEQREQLKEGGELGAEGLATCEGLEQGYVVCPSEKRFLLLFTFLRKNKNKKIMVFFSSCASVQYHHELLNFIDLHMLCIHGKQKQQKRTCTFFQFCRAQSGTLLCTDVAARGLDIPQVDWIVQYDPPDEPREYIHRVGRTARGESGTGNALLILRPEELGFLRFLKAAKVTLNEYEFSWNKLSNIQPQLERLISQNYYLNKSAREAYKGYIRAYDSHSLKKIYDINSLDLLKVCKSFGFETPPFVDLPVSNRPKLAERRTKVREMAAGGNADATSNSNNDGPQFQRQKKPHQQVEFVPIKKMGKPKFNRNVKQQQKGRRSAAENGGGNSNRQSSMRMPADGGGGDGEE